MATPIMNWFSRKVLGKRLNDIELPNESGQVDPELATPARPDVRGQFKKAWDTGKDLAAPPKKGESALEGLQRAGREAMAREAKAKQR